MSTYFGQFVSLSGNSSAEGKMNGKASTMVAMTTMVAIMIMGVMGYFFERRVSTMIQRIATIARKVALTAIIVANGCCFCKSK